MFDALFDSGFEAGLTTLPREPTEEAVFAATAFLPATLAAAFLRAPPALVAGADAADFFAGTGARLEADFVAGFDPDFEGVLAATGAAFLAGVGLFGALAAVFFFETLESVFAVGFTAVLPFAAFFVAAADVGRLGIVGFAAAFAGFAAGAGRSFFTVALCGFEGRSIVRPFTGFGAEFLIESLETVSLKRTQMTRPREVRSNKSN